MSTKTIEQTVVRKAQVIVCDLCGEEILPGVDPWSAEGGVRIMENMLDYDFHARCILEQIRDSIIPEADIEVITAATSHLDANHKLDKNATANRGEAEQGKQS